MGTTDWLCSDYLRPLPERIDLANVSTRNYPSAVTAHVTQNREDIAMATVSPFYSKKNPGVYHVCSNCTVGNNIETENKVSGTGGGSLCQRCRNLQSSGVC